MSLDLEILPGVLFKVDGKPVTGRISVDPGRQRLDVSGIAAALSGIGAEIEALWALLDKPQALELPEIETGRQVELQRAWSVEAGKPAYVRHGDVRFSAEPETDTAGVSIWGNRRLRAGQPGAGWRDGKGTIIMDLGEPVDVSKIRLIRSRYTRSQDGAFFPGEFYFDMELSNDNFQADIRKKEIRHDTYKIHVLENAFYIRSIFFPSFEIPVGDTARYIRITPLRQIDIDKKLSGLENLGYGPGRAVSFVEVEVYREEYEQRMPATLNAMNFGLGQTTVLHQAAGRLNMFTADGNRLWEYDTGYPLACRMSFADTDGDGSIDIGAFTLDEKLLVIGSDGSRKAMADLFAEAMKRRTGPTTGERNWWSGGQRATMMRPNSMAAWMPDEKGRKEFLLLNHHLNAVRVLPDMSASIVLPAFPGGKHAFSVPDSDGDGIEDLAVVGGYGNRFGVLSSASFDGGSLSSLVTERLTGHYSGNTELHLYYHGAKVYDDAGKWLGIAAVNPGGADFFRVPEFSRSWGHFHHPSNLSSAVVDVTGDGTGELLTGREDGYVVAYRVSDGAMVARAALDGEVYSLAASGKYIVTGTENGLVVMDRQLRVTGYLPAGTEAVVFIEDAGEELLLVAAHSDGTLAGYRLVE